MDIQRIDRRTDLILEIWSIIYNRINGGKKRVPCRYIREEILVKIVSGTENPGNYHYISKVVYRRTDCFTQMGRHQYKKRWRSKWCNFFVVTRCIIVKSCHMIIFLPQNPRFSSFKNQMAQLVRWVDGQMEGWTDRQSDGQRLTCPLIKMQSRIYEENGWMDN